MAITKSMFRNRGVIALFGAVALVLGTAGPASAAVVGSGAGTGWEYPPGPAILCTPPVIAGYLTDDTFVLNHTGTMTATGASGTAIAEYVGPVDMIITVDAHLASPLGTHPGDCTASTYPVPGTVDITGAQVSGSASALPQASTGGSIDCTLVSPGGDYIRVSEAVVFTFTATCTIDGNAPLSDGVASAGNVLFVVEGELTPCDIPVPPTPITVPNPACAGAPAGASGHLVTAFEAAAAP